MILDTAEITTPQIEHLVADKSEAVLRYVSPISPKGAKCIQPGEALALAKANIRLGLVCEGWGDFKNHEDDFPQISAQAGARDGKFCANYAATVGAPVGACIYIAIDTDAIATQISRFVVPHFIAVKNAFTAAGTGFLLGAYGSGAVCSVLAKAGLITHAWLSQSMGWSGSKEYLTAKPPELVLVQGASIRIANLRCDPNTAYGDFGDFLPFDISPPTPTVVEAPRPVHPGEDRILAWLEDLRKVL
jgi:hypothetical protein